MASDLETNKEIVKKFYDLIINKKDFEAARPYIGKRYKQHNPLVKDYPEGLKEFIEFLKENYPEARSEIKQVIAEGDYVVLHAPSRAFQDEKRQHPCHEMGQGSGGHRAAGKGRWDRHRTRRSHVGGCHSGDS